jgi:hypothetical protein
LALLLGQHARRPTPTKVATVAITQIVAVFNRAQGRRAQRRQRLVFSDFRRREGPMQRVIIFGVLSVLSVGQGVMVAQSVSDSALVGAWTLNHPKSTFSGAVPYRRVTKFEVVGDAIKETIYTMSTNQPSVLVEYTARFDGNDYPISNSILSMVSLKRVDDRTVERTGKIGGQVVETETRTVSDNDKVLTVTIKGNRDGTEYSSIQVYDRQP